MLIDFSKFFLGQKKELNSKKIISPHLMYVPALPWES